MIKLDKQCRNIVANNLKTSTKEGRKLSVLYSSNKISKKEFVSSLYDLVDKLLSKGIATLVENILRDQAYFEFDPMKQIQKITDSNEVACIIEPVLVRNIMDNGDISYSLIATHKCSAEYLKYYPLNPTKLASLLELAQEHNLVTCAFNWLMTKKDSPSILIFGREGKVADFKQHLLDLYNL